MTNRIFSRPIEKNSGADSLRLGLRQNLDPETTILTSYTYSDLTDNAADVASDAVLAGEEKGHFLELRAIKKSTLGVLNFGLGYQGITEALSIAISGVPLVNSHERADHYSAYVYGSNRPISQLSVEAGVSLDVLNDVRFNKHQTNPKLGIAWYPTSETTIRAAAARTFKRRILSSQTLEPTTVAGFNQFFDDFTATDARLFGLAIDQEIAKAHHVGALFEQRNLKLPSEIISAPGFARSTDWTERWAQGYVFSSLSSHLALIAKYQYEEFIRDELATNSEALARSQTHRVPVEIRAFGSGGIFSRLRFSYIRQSGQFANFATGSVESGSDEFTVWDAAVGLRFPQRQGTFLLEVRNMFDKKFSFQDTRPSEPTISPRRLVFGKIVLWF